MTSWLKETRSGNLAAWDTEELWYELVDSLAELKHRPDLLNAFIDGADRPLTGLAGRDSVIFQISEYK